MFALGVVTGVAVTLVLLWAFDRTDCRGCQ